MLGLGHARRHLPSPSHLGHLPRSLPRILKRQQAEGSGFAGTVASRAIPENDRRNVFIEVTGRSAQAASEQSRQARMAAWRLIPESSTKQARSGRKHKVYTSISYAH